MKMQARLYSFMGAAFFFCIGLYAHVDDWKSVCNITRDISYNTHPLYHYLAHGLDTSKDGGKLKDEKCMVSGIQLSDERATHWKADRRLLLKDECSWLEQVAQRKDITQEKQIKMIVWKYISRCLSKREEKGIFLPGECLSQDTRLSIFWETVGEGLWGNYDYEQAWQ